MVRLDSTEAGLKVKIHVKELNLGSSPRRKRGSTEVRSGREEKEREEDQVSHRVRQFSLAADGRSHLKVKTRELGYLYPNTHHQSLGHGS